MRIDNVSFPYPVLGINDDIRPSLEETKCQCPIIEVYQEKSNIYVDIQVNLQNDDILNYIKNECAEFSVEVSCPSTLYRHCETFKTFHHTFSIPQSRLNVELYFETFVVAKKEIPNYQNKGLNPDYQGCIINLHKGDLLVAFRPSHIELEMDLRNIRNPKSFMSVTKNPDPNVAHVCFNVDDQKIQILIPENTFTKYQDASVQKNTLRASLYLDALVYALLRFNQYKNRNYLWVRTLKYRMQEDAIKSAVDVDLDDLFDDSRQEDIIDDVYKIAQAMLSLPYTTLLNELAEAKENVGPLVN